MDIGASSYRRFVDGDDTALADIVREYRDGLMLFLNGYVRNLHTAEDLTEDTFFELVLKKPKFRELGSFKTWLYAIGRHKAADYIRRGRKSEIPVESLANLPSEETSFESEYLREERKIAVHRVLGVLNASYREILHLLYFEDMTPKETSAALGISRRAVANRTYRAKNALRAELEKEGFCYEEL
jgi:RNA polymerase sigma-70 factor (ECF subfamily)